MLTPAGRKTVDDAGALWDHITDCLAKPGTAAETLVSAVMVTWLVEDAMPPSTVRDRALADILTVEGFRMADGGPVTEDSTWETGRRLRRALQCLNIPEPDRLGLPGRRISEAGFKFLLVVRRRKGHQPIG